MLQLVENTNTAEINYEEAYNAILESAKEFVKSDEEVRITPTLRNENFHKFSLYTDPHSVTSFNTNAIL